MKTRAALKDYFRRGAIPKESDFADLIDSMLVQDEDSVFKSPNDPLSIKATGAEEALLNFYRVEQGANKLTWQLKQKPGNKSGLSIHDGPDSRLFMENGTGNVGIGTIMPVNKLDVGGDLAIFRKHALRGSDNWLRLNQDGAFSGTHTPGFFNTGSLSVGNIADYGNPGFGNVWITGTVSIGTTNQDRTFQVVGSEIHSGGQGAGYSFSSRQTGTFVDSPSQGERWVWYAGDGIARLWSQTDKLSVMPGGNVGIGTSEPKGKLHVANGDIVAGIDKPGQKFIFHTRSGTAGDFLQITGDDKDGNWQWDRGLILDHLSGNTSIRGNLAVDKGIKSPSLGSVFVRAPSWGNNTNSATYISLITHLLDLTSDTYVTVIIHGHGLCADPNKPLDAGIFFNGRLSEQEGGISNTFGWGMLISHSPQWTPVMGIATKLLPAGQHRIEFMYRCRGGGNIVHLSAPVMTIMMTGSR